ncbi:MAG: GGDEF domain-containing protein [Caldimonas sp.]
MRDSIAAALDGDDVLQPAHAALEDSDPERACEIALAALADAESARDPHRRAKALLFLAHLDRLASRFRAAHGRAKQAARLFRTIGDSTGESGALSTLAHASTCLGRNEEAVESALISVRLAEPGATASHKALLFNYLGVAYLWGRDFVKADQALAAAIEWADASGGLVTAFQPLINEVLVEALGAVATRSRTGALPGLDRMATRHARCESLLNRGTSSGLFVGGEDAGWAAWLLTSALMKTWTGASEDADELLAQAQSRLGSDSVPTLGHAYEHWVRAELAWSRGRLAEAAAECTVLVAMAQRLEYEQMACLGHLLLSQIHEQLGETALALAALRSLREREERIRAESLESRERAVEWHLELRMAERNVQQLEGMSRHLERLSLEDSLTGLANRRCLEQRLRPVLAALSANGAPMSIAFIDIDKFKSVNDRHSHHVGDLVLKTVASILVQATRENDLVARLSGDEFAILFQRADEAEATRVCRRISVDFAGFAWSGIAPGLGVTVSIGTAVAHAGDSAESLLHRADSAMYAAKRDAQRRIT